MHKRIAAAVVGISLMGITMILPAHAEVNVNVNVGVPVVPLPLPPAVVLSAPPEFILPPALGFYVAVDIPYDIFFIGSSYYLFRDNGWYRAPYYNGPWRSVERRQLPPGLRKHKFERIREYRDHEYRRYRSDLEGYRGRRFKPSKEWKEQRKEERREEKRHEKERRHMEQEGRGERGRHGDRD